MGITSVYRTTHAKLFVVMVFEHQLNYVMMVIRLTMMVAHQLVPFKLHIFAPEPLLVLAILVYNIAIPALII